MESESKRAKVIPLNMLRRISPKEITIAARRLWQDPLVAETIDRETVDLITKIQKHNLSFFSGKTSRGLVGGLFYLLGYRHDSVKNQKEIADLLGTSDVTIRSSYRNWLEEFPDLFQDIVGKLALDQNLRWYVITDYRRRISQLQL